MIPVKSGMNPIVHVNQAGLVSYQNRSQSRDGIIFRGYLLRDKETKSYGRSGRPYNNQATGMIVDLYA